jgi:hypothetical protein
MRFSVALRALACIGLLSGSAYAVTVGTNALTPAARMQKAVTPPDSTDAADANAAAAETPEADQNPYSGIVRANVFGLKEPPPPPKHDDPAILNLPKVNITGFRKREGEPMHALFATVPKDPKDAPKYFNLAEGEKEDILELKHIDPEQKFVDVVIAGTPTQLTVASNSFVQPIVGPKAGAPVGNNAFGARPPQPVPAPPPAVPPAVPNQPGYNNQYNQGGGGVIVAGGGNANTAVPGTTVYGVPGGPAVPAVPAPVYGNPGVGAGGTVAPATGEAAALHSIPVRGGIPPRDVRTQNPNYNPGVAPQ